MSIRHAGSEHEPAIEHHEIGATYRPAQGPTYADRVQVDQVKLRLIACSEPHEQVSGMKVMMHNAHIVHLGHELAKDVGESLSDHCLPEWLHSRQCHLDKGAKCLGICQTVGQQEAFARRQASTPFPKPQRFDGGDMAGGHCEGAIKLHARLGGPNQLTEPGSPIGQTMVL
jgi:hypothetical protein